MKQISTYVNGWMLRASAALMGIFPATVSAQSDIGIFSDVGGTSSRTIMTVAALLMFSAVLIRIFMGIIHNSYEHGHKADAAAQARHPFIPNFTTMLATIVCTAGLFLLSRETVGNIAPFNGPNGIAKLATFFGCIGLISVCAEYIWPKAKYFVFAFTMGTVVTFILLGFYYMLFGSGMRQDPFFMAMGIITVILAWRFLFGPWSPRVKASMLATFIFWVGLHMIMKEAPDARTARIIATGIALIPAVIWCMLFLKEHKQRMSLVFLMFMAGMLSTAPILFYDAMVRNKVEMQFFLFTVTPENFTRSSNAFVSGNLMGVSGIQSTIIATLISFLIVGLIEEFSKFWVLKKSGQRFFSSIDDVLQLGIIVAIGFAFAENVLNPSYFMAFVNSYLLGPASPQWGAFIGNVLGRAILTNMVHILSTGVFAYFYGLTLFATSILEEEHRQGKVHPIPLILHKVLRLPEKLIYRKENMIIGAVASVVLHGVFNFLVTLPDLLPGNPRTLGDLFQAAPGSPLHFVALLIIPSMFYVVGGFWILSMLFYKKECMRERGVLVRTDTFVPAKTFHAQYS